MDLETADFVGAKVALLHGMQVLAILRDDVPHIPFPGCWELPGGGREPGESPEQCALREVEEELGLRLAPHRLIWRGAYPSSHVAGSTGWFFAAELAAEEIAAVRFGDEGQLWRMMAIDEFLAHPDGVPFLQVRLRACLADLNR